MTPATKTDAAGEAEALQSMLATMVLIRRFEEAVHDLFLRGEVYGSTHLCVGQEGVSAGVAAALSPGDWIACTYRGHGHVLARGSDAQAYMDELLGRASGTSGGRAGSMNVVDLGHRIVGCFGIVGGSIGAATGAALAARQQGDGDVAVAFFGDGTANQAYFHECLNFAKVQRLPAIFVCENNGYGEYTPTEVTTPGGILARAQTLQIHGELVDGQEAWTVRDAAARARSYVIENQEPAFLEVRTYRFSDHGRGDPIRYRPEGEMERWRERDPIVLATARLVDHLGVDPGVVEAIDREQTERVDHIVQSALAAPMPDPADVLDEFASPVS
jgi:TPP-dependent pyruvate/acetoin dehydrogenase alpha subunit